MLEYSQQKCPDHFPFLPISLFILLSHSVLSHFCSLKNFFSCPMSEPSKQRNFLPGNKTSNSYQSFLLQSLEALILFRISCSLNLLPYEMIKAKLNLDIQNRTTCMKAATFCRHPPPPITTFGVLNFMFLDDAKEGLEM
jgi:hypothetical protein